MSILPSFIRSLLLTIIFSFVIPMFLVGGALGSLFLIGYIPGLQAISQAIADAILQFLATFGTGNPFRGLVVISLTCVWAAILSRRAEDSARTAYTWGENCLPSRICERLHNRCQCVSSI